MALFMEWIDWKRKNAKLREATNVLTLVGAASAMPEGVPGKKTRPSF